MQQIQPTVVGKSNWQAYEATGHTVPGQDTVRGQEAERDEAFAQLTSFFLSGQDPSNWDAITQI